MRTDLGKSEQAFALLITLSLLALVLLVLLALSALTKVDSQMVATSNYQIQARQNALLGLDAAFWRLRLLASLDSSLTGTADISPTSKPVNGRWTGVWLVNNSTPNWLVSGNADPNAYAPSFQFGPETTAGRKIIPDSPDDVVLVGNGSTNTSTTADRYFVGDPVIVPRVPIPAYNSSGVSVTLGNFAYWVGDEGVKLSAALPAENPPPSPAVSTHAISEIPGGWTPTTNATKALSYEQLVSNAGAGTTSIKSTFHGATLLHLGYVPVKRGGLININSAGTRLWQGLLGTYDPNMSATKKRNFAAAIATAWTQSSTERVVSGPYTSADGFLVLNSSVQNAIVATGASYNNFRNAISPWLTVRSDTFRIRAYGDAVNPLDTAKIESVAVCEAIVQRVKDSSTPAGEGRFVITFFRWLGPDDI